jgi:signal transduction histidine kinase
MASFIIVIFIDPVKLILKKSVSRLFFEGRDVFTSLYIIDEKLEMEKSMLLEEMASGLAHEIRNPLGSIKGAAQCMRSEADTTEDRKLLDVIIDEADRLSNVVSRFLNYARPYTINAKMQDINSIIEKVISLIKANNLSENIAIRKNLMPDMPKVNVDGEQLMQVILNIAYNGIEAMPEGGILSFTTSKKENRGKESIEIAIQDTGRGIEEKDMKNIFKPFYTTREKGIGLGLSICQRIIRKHGGSIEAKSYPGQGTTFYIRAGVTTQVQSHS